MTLSFKSTTIVQGKRTGYIISPMVESLNKNIQIYISLYKLYIYISKYKLYLQRLNVTQSLIIFIRFRIQLKLLSVQ